MSEFVASNRFLSDDQAILMREQYGSPLYAYSEESLLSQATAALKFPAIHDLTVRFAMKSCPNAAVIQVGQIKSHDFRLNINLEVDI